MACSIVAIYDKRLSFEAYPIDSPRAHAHRRLFRLDGGGFNGMMRRQAAGCSVSADTTMHASRYDGRHHRVIEWLNDAPNTPPSIADFPATSIAVSPRYSPRAGHARILVMSMVRHLAKYKRRSLAYGHGASLSARHRSLHSRRLPHMIMCSSS